MAIDNCNGNSPIRHEYYLTAYDPGDRPLPAPGTSSYVTRFASENFGLSRQVETTRDEGTGVTWVIEGSEVESRFTTTGAITVVPRPDQMNIWLQNILGNAPVGSVYKPAGEICGFYHIGHYDPTQDRIFQYDNLVTNTWTMSASDSSPLLRLEMNVEGGSRRLTDAVNGTVQPTLGLSVVQPFVFCYATLTLDGVEYRMKDFNLSGNNNLDTEGFFNSCERVEIPSTFQEFTFSHQIPFDATPDSIKFLELIAGSANVVGQVVFTSGIYTMTIDMPSLFARPNDPSISGRERVLLPLEWQCQYDPNTANETPITITMTP